MHKVELLEQVCAENTVILRDWGGLTDYHTKRLWPYINSFTLNDWINSWCYVSDLKKNNPNWGDPDTQYAIEAMYKCLTDKLVQLEDFRARKRYASQGWHFIMVARSVLNDRDGIHVENDYKTALDKLHKLTGNTKLK